MARSFETRILVAIALLLIVPFSPLAAQEAASTGEQDEQKSSKAALVLYAEAASYQNNGQFDLAGDEWARFLKEFADDPRETDARYNLAVCQLQQRDFQSAVENLEQVVASANQKFERWEDAYLNLGWCQYSVALQNKPDYFAKATATFRDLLEKYPDGSFSDQALFFGGESLYLQGKFEEAAKSYQKLVDTQTNSDLHSDAMYALGVTQEDMGEYELAGKTYSGFLKTHPDHDLSNEVRMRKAETVLQSGDFKQAADMFGKVAKLEDFRSIDHARYRQAFCIASMADRLGRDPNKEPGWEEQRKAGYVEAGELFGSIVDDMPESPYASDAAIAAGRAFYRAKEFEPASKWFDRIRQSDSSHAPEAAHWLARIYLDAEKSDEASEVVAAVLDSAANHPFYVSLKLDAADARYQQEATQKESVALYYKIFQDHADHRLAPKALYNAAYGAMEVGDFKTGLDYADQFNTKFAEHTLASEVQKVLAECKLQLGQHDDAAKVYKELASRGDNDGNRFELRRGLSLFLKKNYDEAIPVLSKVYDAAADPDQKAEAAYWLGRSFAGKKQIKDAIKAFTNSRTASSEWEQADEVLLNLARAQRSDGQTDKAIATIEELLSTYPESDIKDQTYYRWGEFAYAKNDYAAAIDNYTTVINDYPDSRLIPYSLYGRGWSRLRSGDAKGAIADFDQLQSNYENHELSGQTIYARGMALHQNGDHGASLEAVAAYLEKSPKGSGLSDALYLQGLSRIGLKQYAESIESFERLLAGDDDYASVDKVLYELAWAYRNTNARDKSLQTFTKLIQTSPDSPLAAEAHYHLGENYYAKGDYAKASQEYEAAQTATAADDLRAKSAYKLGWASYQSGKLPDALKAFDQQLEINADDNLAADAEFMRGECYYKQNQFEDAFEAYRRAKAKPSRNETMQVLTLLHGGQSAAQLKDWNTSLEWLAELQSNFPNSAYLPQATYERGWAQRNLGQLDDALNSFNQVTATSRNELGARARFMIGEVLFEQKDYNAAILEFRRVMFGYDAEKAPPAIKRWQAKAAFEAGRCATVLAGREQNPQRRSQLVEGAKGFFRYVTEKHAQSTEAGPAAEQLKRLQPQASRVSNRPAGAATGR